MLAPHAKLRAAVVATAGPGEALASHLREAAARMELDGEAELPAPPPVEFAWDQGEADDQDQRPAHSETDW